jgi:hypothetical protein
MSINNEKQFYINNFFDDRDYFIERLTNLILNKILVCTSYEQ